MAVVFVLGSSTNSAEDVGTTVVAVSPSSVAAVSFIAIVASLPVTSFACCSLMIGDSDT